MEHLVESHMGGYYVSSLDEEIITEYCEECGDSDWIILSWEEGQMMEALSDYFSKPVTTRKVIEDELKAGITKSEAINNILYSYGKDRYLIEYLFYEKIIDEEDKNKLMKINLQTRKSMISLVCEIYPKKVKKKSLRKED